MDRGLAEPLASSSQEFLALADSPPRGTPAYRRYARGAQKCYKPISTQWPFLVCIILLIFGLIAIVEVACHNYPIENYDQSSFLSRKLKHRDLIIRSEDEAWRHWPRGNRDGQQGHIRIRNETSQTSSRPSEETFTTIPGAYISATSQSAGVPSGSDNSATPSLPISTSFTGSHASVAPGSANEGAYIPSTTYTELSTGPGAYIPTNPTVSPSALEGAYIPTSSPGVITTVTLGGGGVAGDETGTTIPGAYMTPTTLPKAAGSTNGESYNTDATSSEYHPFKTINTAYLSPTVTSSDAGGVSTTITFPDSDITGTTIPGAYITSSSIPVPSASDGAYISTPGMPNVLTTITLPQGGSTGPVPPSTYVAATNQGAYISGTSSIISTPTIISGVTAMATMGIPTTNALVPVSTIQSGGIEVVVVETPSASSLVPISTLTSNGITKIVYGLPSETETLKQPTNLRASASGAYSVITTVVTSTSGNVAYVYKTTMTLSSINSAAQSASMASITSSTGSYPVITTLVTSISGNVAYVYKTTMTLSPTVSPVPAIQTAASTGSDSEKSLPPFTPLSYFTAWYLPTMIAVALRTIWTVVYNNARMMEPFYRLAVPNGVNGGNSLISLYLSMGTIVPEPILALFSGHSYMFIVSSITYVIEILAPMSSEFLAVDVQHGCTPGPESTVNQPCPPRLIVRLLPARILQGVLGLIGCLIITAIFLGYHRQPGIYSDPSCIATMASLLHHPEVLDDFKDLADADDSEVARLLDEQTYRLAHYQAGAEGMKYGIVPVIRTTKSEIRTKGAYSAVSNPENATLVQSHRRTFLQKHLWRTLGDIVLGSLLLGLLGVIVAFYLDGSSDGFNVFFLSQSFGPRFILVLAGGLIVTQWKRIEREVRTYQPYRYLSSKAISSPTHTILCTTTSSPWTTLPKALYHGQFFAALVAFCYIMAEILVIVVATIPFSGNQYYLAFLSGTYITFGILGLQILVFTFTVTWWRWKGPRLGRDPDTLLGVWTLLAHSEIRNDFEDLGTAGRNDLVETVKALGRRYWLGKTIGKDGVTRMGIHSEESLAGDRVEGFVAVRPESALSHDPY